MDDLVAQVLADIKANPEWAMLVIALTAFAESFVFLGLVLPGTAILIAVGALLSAHLLEPVSTLLSGIVGAVVGYSVSFWIGQKFGPVLPHVWPFRNKPDLIMRGVMFFEQHGQRSVFVGRFVGPLRAVIPLTAGMMRMPAGRFHAASILSGVIWAPAIILLGAVLGRSLSGHEATLTKISQLVLLGVALTGVAYWMRRQFMVPASMEPLPMCDKVSQDTVRMDSRRLGGKAGTSEFSAGGVRHRMHERRNVIAEQKSGQKAYFRSADQPTMLPGETPYILRHFQTLITEGGITRGQRVLEIGAGMGRFTCLFEEAGVEVVATDVSPEQIAELKTRFPSIHTAVAGADDLPVDLGTFDAVVGFFVLHHLPDLKVAFQSFRRLLKPGGVVAFCEPQAFYIPYYLQIWLTPRMRWSVERGTADMRKGVLSPILQSAGFSDLSYRYYGHFPPLLYNSRIGRSTEQVLEALPLPGWARAFQIVQGRAMSGH